jgi:hypothetical protein
MRFLKSFFTGRKKISNQQEKTEEPIRYTYEKNIFNENVQALKILNGKYRQVVFAFGKVKFSEKSENTTVSFTYDVISNPGGLETDSTEFRNLLGDILLDVMNQNIGSDGEFLYESSRDADTGKSDTQRGIRKKNSTVS